MQAHKIVPREEWLAARKAHLIHEKEATRQLDRLAAERRNLPWVKVEKVRVTLEREASGAMMRQQTTAVFLWISMPAQAG